MLTNLEDPPPVKADFLPTSLMMHQSVDWYPSNILPTLSCNNSGLLNFLFQWSKRSKFLELDKWAGRSISLHTIYKIKLEQLERPRSEIPPAA